MVPDDGCSSEVGLGNSDWVSALRVHGLGFRVSGPGLRVRVLKVMASELEFRVHLGGGPRRRVLLGGGGRGRGRGARLLHRA